MIKIEQIEGKRREKKKYILALTKSNEITCRLKHKRANSSNAKHSKQANNHGRLNKSWDKVSNEESTR